LVLGMKGRGRLVHQGLDAVEGFARIIGWICRARRVTLSCWTLPCYSFVVQVRWLRTKKDEVLDISSTQLRSG